MSAQQNFLPYFSFFSVAEAAEILNVSFFPAKSGKETLSNRFRVDSRQVGPGDVFVAMRGECDDGHNYVMNAVQGGASAILLESAYFEAHADELIATGAVFFPVANPEESMAMLAETWLRRISPVVVGITGSVGKTTTRELLAAVLRENRRIHAAVKSYNTLVGCSMTILAMPADTEVLILELGTNHPGEIRDLVQRFPVTHGVITEIAPSHLEGLNSLEGVLAAKLELLESKQLQFLSYNNDNDALKTSIAKFAQNHAKVRVVGIGYSDADITISDVRQSLDDDGMPLLSLTLMREVWKDAENTEKESELACCCAPIFGKQHAKNVAFAYVLSRELGVSAEKFVKVLAGLGLPPGRGGLFWTSNGTLIVDESYNASPVSVSHALKNVVELELPNGYRRIAVLGGMRELGKASLYWHEVVMSRASLFDEVYLIGGEWDDVETKQDALKGRWPSVTEFAQGFEFDALGNAIVLLKGSRYYRMEELLAHFGVARKH